RQGRRVRRTARGPRDSRGDRETDIGGYDLQGRGTDEYRWRAAPLRRSPPAARRGYARRVRDKRTAALLGLWLALPWGCGPGAAPPPQRIVLASIDTLRADHVGCYGAARAATPEPDTNAAPGGPLQAGLRPAPRAPP